MYVGEKSNKNEVLIKKDSLDWLKGHLINRKKNSCQKYLAKMLARIVRIVQKEDRMVTAGKSTIFKIFP